jgi:hypothetical protein
LRISAQGSLNGAVPAVAEWGIMRRRELTMEELADVLTRITGATPCDANLRRHVLVHDASIRAERDALKAENDDLLHNLSLCKGNELAQQVADLTKERDELRSQLDNHNVSGKSNSRFQ